MVWVKAIQTEIRPDERTYHRQVKEDVGYFYDKTEEELKPTIEEKNQALVDMVCSGCGNMIPKEDKIWGSRFKPICWECSHIQEQGGNTNPEWNDEPSQWEWRDDAEHKTIEGNIPTNIRLKCNNCGLWCESGWQKGWCVMIGEPPSLEEDFYSQKSNVLLWKIMSEKCISKMWIRTLTKKRLSLKSMDFHCNHISQLCL